MKVHYGGATLVICCFLAQFAGARGQGARIQRTVCSGSNFLLNCSTLGRSYENTTIRLLSLTVYATPLDPATYRGNASAYCRLRNCSRSSTDAAFLVDQPDYQYLYSWLLAQCQGAPSCYGTLPAADRLVAANEQCSKADRSFFSAALLDITCVRGINPSASMPPATTELSSASSQTESTDPPRPIPVESGYLSETEKIVLAAVVCTAVVVLFSLLVLLSCCDQIRRDRRRRRLLLRIGKPVARTTGIFDETSEYAMAWRAEIADVQAVGECTGVKPEEVLTIDKRKMDRTDAPVQEGSATIHRRYGSLHSVHSGEGNLLQTMRPAATRTSSFRPDGGHVNTSYMPSALMGTDVMHS